MVPDEDGCGGGRLCKQAEALAAKGQLGNFGPELVAGPQEDFEQAMLYGSADLLPQDQARELITRLRNNDDPAIAAAVEEWCVEEWATWDIFRPLSGPIFGDYVLTLGETLTGRNTSATA